MGNGAAGWEVLAFYIPISQLPQVQAVTTSPSHRETVYKQAHDYF